MAVDPAPTEGVPPVIEGADGRPPGFWHVARTLVRSWLLFVGIKWLIQQSKGRTSVGNETDGRTIGEQLEHGLVRSNPSRGSLVDVFVYVGEESPFRRPSLDVEPIWTLKGIVLGGIGAETTVDLRLERRWKENETIPYAFVYVSPSGSSPNPWDPTFDATATVQAVHPLAFHAPAPKEKEESKLLERKTTLEIVEEEAKERPWAMFIRPNLTIDVIDLLGNVALDKTHPQIRSIMRVDRDKGTFRPLLWMNDFWILKERCILVNETVDEIKLGLSWNTQPVWKWQLLTQMEQSFAMQEQFGAMAAGESDHVKKIFLEGNPFMLALTMFVSLLHTVFDVFAFKNDIGFWKSNKSMEGLSARTILINVFCQLIILLYLLDNETSFVVLLSSAMGLLIEVWKVTKAMNVTLRSEGRWVFKVQDRDSYKKSKTKEYDEVATRYLSYVLYPLIFCYTVYSLLYQDHKGWYSFILNTLVGCVYTFGFILMCPQLYINYRLKSVAHLPWRQMSYKFLNTIIDDLFAFVIHMPLMHRLSVFRDDVVFMIYLYQRWIYPVDKKRVNEFGYSAEQPEVQESNQDQGNVVDGSKLATGENTVQETDVKNEEETLDSLPETKKDK